MSQTDLPPSPELDALVAKAMGQDVRRVPDDRGGLEWEMRDPGGDWVAVPAYSTTGNGMLAMLEWMRAKPRQWYVVLYSPAQGEEGDNCQFCRGGKGNVKGNENVFAGVLVCDDCSILLSPIQAEAEAEGRREGLEEAAALAQGISHVKGTPRDVARELRGLVLCAAESHASHTKENPHG